jgi:ESS family glutamate:Na+ symporter
MTTTIQTPGFLTFTIAIVVFFVGAGLNRWIAPLRRWNIPEAVTGGLLAALVTLAAHEAFGLAISFDLGARDMLLLYFFTGIGLNARLGDLLTGGRPFLVLLALTLVFLVIQNLIAAGSAAVLGLPKGITVLLGSASLMGGHGTTIAWAPLIEARYGLTNAMEIGVAAATLGLVVASIVGGPVAGFLISRHGLKGSIDEAPAV